MFGDSSDPQLLTSLKIHSTLTFKDVTSLILYFLTITCRLKIEILQNMSLCIYFHLNKVRV